MCTILVDWMVEVQENFELNHETLYGITSQHLKLSPAESSAPTHVLHATSSSVNASSSVEKVDKAKSLKLCMPNEKKMPSTKSDLIDILTEKAEVHAALAAINTPQKVDGQFPFYPSKLPDGKRTTDFSKELFNESAKEVNFALDPHFLTVHIIGTEDRVVGGTM